MLKDRRSEARLCLFSAGCSLLLGLTLKSAVILLTDLEYNTTWAFANTTLYHTCHRHDHTAPQQCYLEQK